VTCSAFIHEKLRDWYYSCGGQRAKKEFKVKKINEAKVNIFMKLVCYHQSIYLKDKMVKSSLTMTSKKPRKTKTFTFMHKLIRILIFIKVIPVSTGKKGKLLQYSTCYNSEIEQMTSLS
jgi:hypothetical protein